MARSVLNAPHFQSEAAAFEYVEAHLWPNGPVCPHCGEDQRVGRLNGKTTRPGLCKCYACKKPFTVRMGTIFESSHLPLNLWLQAIHLMCASKKGISARQLQRMLDCSMKTAWFLGHRIREAMATDSLPPFGAAGGTVEADETFIGFDPDRGFKRKTSTAHMNKVLSIVDRESGKVRSFVIPRVASVEIAPIIAATVSPNATLSTDEGKWYARIGGQFVDHWTVNHGVGEYVSGEAHTNTVEGTFSIFKRGMRGIYQHCAKKHLHRYLAEFDFRYSNRVRLGIDDVQRADIALRGFAGKRLTYETVSRRRAAGETRIVW
jgi:transposase-like protein